jgi:hypothetical protein
MKRAAPVQVAPCTQCPQGHALRALPGDPDVLPGYNRPWSCGACQGRFTARDARDHCARCDYSHCGGCAAARAVEAALSGLAAEHAALKAECSALKEQHAALTAAHRAAELGRASDSAAVLAAIAEVRADTAELKAVVAATKTTDDAEWRSVADEYVVM